jgi:uncharacterized protein
MRPESDELRGIEAVNRRWIDDLIAELRRRISLDSLFLFGSRAADEHTTWSDYDVCVISEDFRGLRPWERMELVLECWDGARALEPVCFTPEEFRRGRAWIVREIRRRGRRLYPLPDDRLSGPRPDPGP